MALKIAPLETVASNSPRTSGDDADANALSDRKKAYSDDAVAPTEESSEPGCFDIQVDGCWIAPPIREKGLTKCQKARFRVFQLLNFILIVAGTYVTMQSLISSIAKYNNEKINPTTTTSSEIARELPLPQILICSWGHIKANSVKCIMMQQAESGEPLCYDSAGKLDPYTIPESHPNHWSKGKTLGAKCYDTATELAASYDCTKDVKQWPANHFKNDDETCFSVNGPSATTPTKIKTKNALQYPFRAKNSGWQNQIYIKFEHDMTDCEEDGFTDPASDATLNCYFGYQKWGVYWGILDNDHQVTTRDTENFNYLLEADYNYLHSMTKKIIVNEDDNTTQSFWSPASSSTLQSKPVSNSMTYSMGFFYSELSVTKITIANSFGLLEIIEAVGGSSGLLLGLSGYHFLSWGMQIFGLLGWAAEAPEGPFPRKYL